MHAWPQPKKWTPALTQGLNNKRLMRMITGSLFTDRGDQCGTFKKTKGQHLLWSVGIRYYNSSSYGPLRTIIVIYAPRYIWQNLWLLVTIDTIMIFDTNGTSNDKIAMGKMMAWFVPQPKENKYRLKRKEKSRGDILSNESLFFC